MATSRTDAESRRRCSETISGLPASLLVVSLTMVTGCSLNNELIHHHHAPEPPPGTVDTGGPLARTAVLEIPKTGLSLGEAVDRTLRPGVMELLLSSAVATPTAGNAADVPIADRTGPLPPGNNNAQDGNVDSSTINAGPGATGVDPGTINVDPGTVNPPHDGGPIVTPPVRPSVASHHDVRVRLSRPSGQIIIMPLRLVQSTSAGDITLTNGDRVDVLWHSQTSTAVPSASDGTINLSGLTTAPGAAQFAAQSHLGHVTDFAHDNANIAIVTRPLGNRLEEHLLPLERAASFGGADFQQRMLSSTYLQHGDHVQFGILELNPIILGSQVATRMAHNAGDEEEQDHLHQLLEEKESFVRGGVRSIKQLPIISSLRQGLSAQSGIRGDDLNAEHARLSRTAQSALPGLR